MDLAFQFGYLLHKFHVIITTWTCFMHPHFKEIDWISTVKQVFATQPCAFKDKFPTKFVMINTSEVFIEPLSDLHLQSSKWFPHYSGG